ncbi:MAG: DUF1573 domain-containing protein [Lentimicrobiaceae bacterium]|nr:DUF1573 domain-containing protein [Lentimicrobiaceae bacterium]
MKIKKTFQLLAFTGLLYATPNAQPVLVTPDSILFEKTVHDYGTILKGSEGVCEFKFINQGKAPQILSTVKASCGCTVPEWSKDAILPGKTGVIKVKYNTQISGNFNRTIFANSNARNSLVMLRITGDMIVNL